MKRQHLAIILITAAIITASSLTLVLLSNTPVDPEPVHYTYNIVNVYPHDETAFTQGLAFEDGFLYEGTGLYGQSTIRRVELDTGNIIQLQSLPHHFFGEGITIFEDKIIQLTW
jgi:glutamine cyclotransferase